MKNKSVLDAMKKYVEVTLDSTPLDLLVIGTASSTDQNTPASLAPQKIVFLQGVYSLVMS